MLVPLTRPTNSNWFELSGLALGVFVKKSSPLPTVGQLSANCRPTVGKFYNGLLKNRVYLNAKLRNACTEQKCDGDWDHMPVRGLGLKSKWRTNLRTIAFKEKSAVDDLELIPMEPLIDSGRSILCKFVFRRENDRLKPTIMKIFLKL